MKRWIIAGLALAVVAHFLKANSTYDKDAGAWYVHLGEHTFLHTIEQWQQFIRRDNWYTFNPLYLRAMDVVDAEWEWDKMAPGFEVTLIVLGLGLRLRHNFSWVGTELQAAIDAMEARIAHGMPFEDADETD